MSPWRPCTVAPCHSTCPMRAFALALCARAASAIGRRAPRQRTPSPLSSQRRLAGCPPARRA
eukprot:10107110-Alexandrium_andersonii.AAC.1